MKLKVNILSQRVVERLYVIDTEIDYNGQKEKQSFTVDKNLNHAEITKEIIAQLKYRKRDTNLKNFEVEI